MTQRVPASPLTIWGAGPAGLAAAIVAAQKGARVLVCERKSQLAARFHGDFQGLENWSAAQDVREELAAFGIWGFASRPFRALTVLGPDGQVRRFVSSRPLFYLVRRGDDEGTLDRALLARAKELGVEVRWGVEPREAPQPNIVATGPRRAHVIAAGWCFRCALQDGAWAWVDERIAPGGYAYLLVWNGCATLAVCLFRRFREAWRYAARAAAGFERWLGFSLPSNAKRIGGYGQVFWPPCWRNGTSLAVGEAAGLQDALWGFGLRFACISGALAAQAWLAGAPEQYPAMAMQRLGAALRAGFVYRALYGAFGNAGYRWFLDRLVQRDDPLAALRRRFEDRQWLRLAAPAAARLWMHWHRDRWPSKGGTR